MRVICGYCSNIGKEICKDCDWIHSRYPSQYAGRKFPNATLKLLQEPKRE